MIDRLIDFLLRPPVFATLVIALIAGMIWLAWLGCYMEARTYNRLTGASVTAWDAMWVELRVDGRAD